MYPHFLYLSIHSSIEAWWFWWFSLCTGKHKRKIIFNKYRNILILCIYASTWYYNVLCVYIINIFVVSRLFFPSPHKTIISYFFFDLLISVMINTKWQATYLIEGGRERERGGGWYRYHNGAQRQINVSLSHLWSRSFFGTVDYDGWWLNWPGKWSFNSHICAVVFDHSFIHSVMIEHL